MALSTLLLLLGLATSPVPTGAHAAPLKVVTSLPTYAAIAREIVGDKGTVTSIARGDEDPHFVQPKPSFVALLRDAEPLRHHRARPGALGAGAAGPGRQPDRGRRWSGLRLRLERRRAARGADVAQPRRWRHPRGRKSPHPLRSAQRHHHRPQHPRRPAAGLPRERGVLRGAGAGLRATGARGDHGTRAGRHPHPGHGFRPAAVRPAARFREGAEVPGPAARRQARRLAAAGRGVPGEGDGLLPQGVGLLQPPVRGALRRVRRGEAGDPTHAEACAGADRADEGAEDPRPVRGELLQPRPDPAGGHPHRGGGGDRA